MPMMCSAMRKGDRTVGTSTNCSADCGSGTKKRDGHGEQEILGTSITCSAIGRSRIRKVSVTFSTTCGTGRSRICTNRASSPRSLHDVPLQPHMWPPAAHTDRVAGNRPGGRGASETPPCGTTRTSPPVWWLMWLFVVCCLLFVVRCLFSTRAEVSRLCMITNAVLIGMGALNGKELCAIEGSEKLALNSRTTRGARKMAKKAEKPVKPPGAINLVGIIMSRFPVRTSRGPPSERRKYDILPKARGLTHERSTNTLHRNNGQIFKCVVCVMCVVCGVWCVWCVACVVVCGLSVV